MIGQSFTIDELLLKNLISLKTLKSKEDKINFLKKLLEKNFGKFISRNNIYKKLNIKEHRYRYFLDNYSDLQYKIGNRIFVETSIFAELIYKDYKDILEEKLWDLKSIFY